MGFDELKKAAEMSESVAARVREAMKPIEKAAESARLFGEAMKPARPIELEHVFRLPVLPIDPNLASEFKKRLIKWVNEFDASLDSEHEVGARLVSFGQTVTIHLLDIGYWNPSLIVFRGTRENGEPAELIQHVSQISVLLVKVKRLDPTTPKRPIGFVWDADSSEK